MAEITPDIIEQLTDDKLLILLDQRHADYDDVLTESTTYLDLYNGDRSKLCTETYIPRSSAEEDVDYKHRLKITEPIPETQKIINRAIGAVFEPDPTHEIDDSIASYLENANKRNMSHMQIINDAAQKALAAGMIVGFVDTVRPTELGDERATSFQQAIESGYRVVTSIYDPSCILNYKFDDLGLEWIHLVDRINEQTQFTTKSEKYSFHRLITRNYIYTFKVVQVEGKRTIKDKGIVNHNLNQCPCEFLIYVHDRDRGLGIGKSMIRNSARADIAVLRNESHLAYVLDIMGTPQLYRKMSQEEFQAVQTAHAKEISASAKNGRAVDYTNIAKKLQLGYTTYHIMGKDGEIGYAQLDTGGIEKLMEVIEKLRSKANEQAGYDAQDIWNENANISNESGISKAFSYAMGPANQIEHISTITAEFDRKILRLVCKSAGVNEDSAKVSYPQPRMVAPIDQLIGEYEFMTESGYPDEVIHECQVSIFNRFFWSDSLDQATKNTLIELIQNQTERSTLSNEMNQFGSNSTNSNNRSESNV